MPVPIRAERLGQHPMEPYPLQYAPVVDSLQLAQAIPVVALVLLGVIAFAVLVFLVLSIGPDRG